MIFRTILVVVTFVFSYVNALVVPIGPSASKQRAVISKSQRHPLFRDDTLGLSSTYDSTNELSTNEKEKNNPISPLEWVSLGISSIYLAHFASLYTQLPGLFGQTGLLPIADRVSGLDGNLWLIGHFQSPEFGMEVFAALGIVVSASQIVFRRLRHGFPGILSFGMLWIFWHDLVVSGGRFMAYQMDLLLLDAAPLTLLAASGLAPAAALFGYRWLLSRLYIGAGAVKLLSCDASWRDLSAVHWHFQSQPLPNPLGAAAFLHLPEFVSQAITLAVLIVEMVAPFLYLVPSPAIRRVSFVLNILLMVGIALFGNFGPLQALLIVIGFSLLDDVSLHPENAEQVFQLTEAEKKDEVDISSGITVVSSCLAAWATLWTIHDVGARCLDTWSVEPLVYGLIAVGASAACLPFFLSTTGGTITALLSLAIFLGSAPTMADGLGVYLPFGSALEYLNFGASPYGLFATMTGVNGRPVATIEAAQSIDGLWKYVPLLYQVNDPTGPLPLCFPHFPRLDWTLWFIPFGEQGLWIARFFNGITLNDPNVVGLLDKSSFYQTFPDEPPAIVRVVPRKYELDAQGGWLVSNDIRYSQSPVLATFTRGDLASMEMEHDSTMPWPVTPLRPLAEKAGRPEYFIWECLGAAGVGRRAVQSRNTVNMDERR